MVSLGEQCLWGEIGSRLDRLNKVEKFGVYRVQRPETDGMRPWPTAS